MAVESLLVFGLALRDFALAATLTATLGSVTLLAISGIGVWAAYATWLQHDSWLGASLLGQFSIAVLAGYIVVVAVRSPFPQFFELDWFPLRVAGLACILGIFAIFWVFYLIRHWRGPVTAGTKTIVALIPLLGFVQFWLQTDYLPRTSLPLVDVTTDLTPTGETGDNVQLEAKVTINNRSSVQVNVGATVMRIIAYPRAPGMWWRPNQMSDAIQLGYAPSREYRDDPLQTDQGLTLYARDLLPANSVLAPGESTSFRRVIDFNYRTMRLARLAVDAIFITSPRIGKMYTCPQPQRSADDASFQAEISKVITDKSGAQFLCREVRLAPRNVIHEMVGDHISFALMVILKDPNPKKQSQEYPALLWLTGVNGNYNLNSSQKPKGVGCKPSAVYQNCRRVQSVGAVSPSREKVTREVGGTMLDQG
jgi:hypothetical protein